MRTRLRRVRVVPAECERQLTLRGGHCYLRAVVVSRTYNAPPRPTSGPRLTTIGEPDELIARFGFTYKTCAVWDKDRIGLGSWYRQQHELLFVATRGKMPAPAPATRPASVIRSLRGAQSAKPDIVREQIERMCPGVPRVELLARGPVPGRYVWGLEAEPVESAPRAG